jgi:UV DNA damage endonuclease
VFKDPTSGTRFGYACINMTLAAEGVTTNRGCVKRTWLEKGLPHVSRLALQNCQDLLRTVEWNRDRGVEVFRMTSCLFPWHTEYELEQLPDWGEIRTLLERVGKTALGAGQRLSFHPGQHNVLSSPRESVVENSIRDLRAHGEIMDHMGLPRTPGAKINLHVGGAYGEPAVALERLCEVVEKKLPDSVRLRLTFENDDKPGMFSTRMLYEGVYERVGVPIVFDSHHFECGPQDSTYEEALNMAVKSWPERVRPQCHHTNSRRDWEDSKAGRVAHSDWYYTPFFDLGHSVDVVLECKMKELALEKYRQDFLNPREQGPGVLLQPHSGQSDLACSPSGPG